MKLPLFLFMLMVPFDGFAFEIDRFQNLSFILDKSGSLTFDQVSSDSFEDKFKPAAQSNFGPTEGRLWLRFQLDLEDIEEPALFFDQPVLMEINFYQPVGDGEWSITKAGILTPLAKEAERPRIPVFRITKDLNGERYIYLSVRTTLSLVIPMSIMPMVEVGENESKQMLFLTTYLGCIFIMVLYNLSLFVTLRDKSYLYYSLAVTSVHGFSLMGMAGLTNTYLWPGSRFMLVNQATIWTSLGTLFTGLFAMAFLNSKGKFPKTHKILAFLVYTSPVYVIMTFFTDYYFLSLPAGIQAIISSIIYIVLAARASIRGDRPALIFFLAWMTLIFSVAFLAISFAGVMQVTFWTQRAPLVGAVAEALLLSIALGFRYKELETEKTRLSAEVEAAVLVQEAFVADPPKDSRIEVASLSLSADLTGGDWHGFHYDQRRGLYLIVCGDATGHGLSASLIAGVAAGAANGYWQHYFKTNVEQQADPEKLLVETIEIVNGAIFRLGTKLNKAMTLIAIAIDVNSGKSWLANAGHNFPIIFGSERMQPLGLPGSILGHQSDNLLITVKEIQLNEGEAFLVYTDGLIENTGPTGKTFHLKRTLKRMRRENFFNEPGQLLDKLMHDGQEIWKETPSDDDCTLIVIRWQPDKKVA